MSAAGPRMQPLARFPAATLACVRGVLADLDETITTHGRLSVAAYDAVARLQAAGVWVLVVTGRAAGWCDHLARTWPVDAVIGENGGLWLAARDGRITRHYAAAGEARERQRELCNEALARVTEAVPAARPAGDQRYRETDLAIDWNEEAHLSEAEVERVLAVLRAAGARTTRSTIHLHGTFGDHDKMTTTALALRERFGVDADAVRDELVFVGDSLNDAPMFRFFTRTSVGVANVRDCVDRLDVPPAYVAVSARGAGFVELVDLLLAARAERPA